MNSPECSANKVEDDLQDLLNKVQNITQIMGITPIESVNFATYQLKGVTQTKCIQWKEGRYMDA